MPCCELPLPSYEYYRYGPPVPMICVLDGLGQFSIAPDPDRSILTFWAATGNVAILPDSSSPETGIVAKIGPSFGVTSQPIVFAYDRDGIITTMGFMLTGAVGTVVQLLVAKRVPIRPTDTPLIVVGNQPRTIELRR